MFHLDFLVGVLSFDEGLVRWDQLRRNNDSATIVMAIEVRWRVLHVVVRQLWHLSHTRPSL